MSVCRPQALLTVKSPKQQLHGKRYLFRAPQNTVPVFLPSRGKIDCVVARPAMERRWSSDVSDGFQATAHGCGPCSSRPIVLAECGTKASRQTDRSHRPSTSRPNTTKRHLLARSSSGLSLSAFAPGCCARSDAWLGLCARVRSAVPGNEAH